MPSVNEAKSLATTVVAAAAAHCSSNLQKFSTTKNNKSYKKKKQKCYENSNVYMCLRKCAFVVNKRRAATAAHLSLLRLHGWWAPAAFLCLRKC